MHEQRTWTSHDEGAVILGWYRTARARRSAMRVLGPLLAATRSKFRDLSPTIWLDGYLMGFMPMLITLLAVRSSRYLKPDDMAEIQSLTWSQATGLSSTLLGELLIERSLRPEPDFENGCRDAARLMGELLLAEADAAHMLPHGVSCQTAPFGTPPEMHDVSSLWSECIDARILVLVGAPPAAMT